MELSSVRFGIRIIPVSPTGRDRLLVIEAKSTEIVTDFKYFLLFLERDFEVNFHHR